MTPEKKKEEAEQPVIECASPPCLLHEVDPAYSGLGESPDVQAPASKQPSPEASEGEAAEQRQDGTPACPEPPVAGKGA
jgi:hypothetical protein